MKALLNKYKDLPVQMKASLWFLLCAFLQKGVSFFTTPIFTRLLTTEEYGQYSVFNSWYSIVAVFVSLNLSYGVYAQGLVKFEDERNQFISSLQGLTVTLVFVWIIIYLIFHDFWNALFSLTTVQMLAMIAMIWTTAVFNFWSMEQRTELKYRALVSVTILVSLAKPLLGIFLVIHCENKVTARILGLVLVELIVYVGMFFIQIFRGKKFFFEKFWKYALTFNLPLIPHYLSSSVLNSADRIMIRDIVDSGAAGIYNLAYNVSQIMTMFNMALMQTIEPWLLKKIKMRRLDDISGVAYPALIIIAILNITLIALAPEVVAIFAPEEYCDAIWVIPPVTISVYFMFSYNFFSVFEFYYEKTNFIAIATIAGAVLNVILNYFCIRRWGYLAAGYTTVICYIVYAVMHYCFMYKICQEKFKGKHVYSVKILMLITGVFLLLCIGFMILYQSIVLRYSFIVVILIVLIIEKKKIIDIVSKLVDVRKFNRGIIS